jgi:hypothetical protein
MRPKRITPTKRLFAKRQVSKRLVSKRLKRQVYKTSGLQNVRFTKRQVFKTSGCKKTSKNILYLWLVEIRRLCCSHAAMLAGKVMAVFYFAIDTRTLLAFLPTAFVH